MEQRERLIELLNETFEQQYEKRGILTADHTADFLLENGVIVPPCKVGDTVYKIIEEREVDRIREYKIRSIECDDFSSVVVMDMIIGPYIVPRDQACYFSDFGKTVFLTREEAVKANISGWERKRKE